MDPNPQYYIQSFVALEGEEDFWRVFTIYGLGGHLGHVTLMPRTIFCSSYPLRLHTRFSFDWLSGFRHCERQQTDCLTYGRLSMGILLAHLWACGSLAVVMIDRYINALCLNHIQFKVRPYLWAKLKAFFIRCRKTRLVLSPYVSHC